MCVPSVLKERCPTWISYRYFYISCLLACFKCELNFEFSFSFFFVKNNTTLHKFTQWFLSLFLFFFLQIISSNTIDNTLNIENIYIPWPWRFVIVFFFSFSKKKSKTFSSFSLCVMFMSIFFRLHQIFIKEIFFFLLRWIFSSNQIKTDFEEKKNEEHQVCLFAL